MGRRNVYDPMAAESMQEHTVESGGRVGALRAESIEAIKVAGKNADEQSSLDHDRRPPEFSFAHVSTGPAAFSCFGAMPNEAF